MYLEDDSFLSALSSLLAVSYTHIYCMDAIYKYVYTYIHSNRSIFIYEYTYIYIYIHTYLYIYIHLDDNSFLSAVSSLLAVSSRCDVNVRLLPGYMYVYVYIYFCFYMSVRVRVRVKFAGSFISLWCQRTLMTYMHVFVFYLLIYLFTCMKLWIYIVSSRCDIYVGLLPG
jgi:hypothetical protein